MGKKQYIKTRYFTKAPQSIQEVYKERLRVPQKTEKGEQQKTTLPQIEPNQSTKSTMEEGPETKYTLAHAQRLQRKETLSP